MCNNDLINCLDLLQAYVKIICTCWLSGHVSYEWTSEKREKLKDKL